MSILPFAKEEAIKGRSFFLGDIENLAWNLKINTITETEVRKTSNQIYECLTHLEAIEIIACSTFFADPVLFNWGRNARFLIGSGPNAADLKLITAIYTEEVAQRFDTIFIGSGDGIFLEPVQYLISMGLRVCVIHRRDRLSKRLQLAAHNTICLDRIQPKAA